MSTCAVFTSSRTSTCFPDRELHPEHLQLFGADSSGGGLWGVMPDYAVFGGCLRSDIAFRELALVQSGRPDWTLRTVQAVGASCGAERLGQDQVDGSVYVRLYRRRDGYLLEFDDTGSFEVSAGGSEIRWCPGPHATLEAARTDVIGRVLAVALHASGTLSLHGSAVALGCGGVAFLAPKFHGKSTLALALANAGARLITDDTLPVDPGPPASVRPGVHSLRLWDDSVARLGSVAAEATPPRGEKHLVKNLPDARMLLVPTALHAIYLLSPVASTNGVAVRRTRLSAVPSVLSLVRHAKLGPLLGRSESVHVFESAVAIARTVPVYTLEVFRDFDRLPEVVEELMGWHAGGVPTVPEASQ